MEKKFAEIINEGCKSGKTIVANAVKKGWITEEQFKEITGKEYA